MKHPGVGIIGLGFIGHAHAEALRRLGIPVLAVASRELERARQKATSRGELGRPHLIHGSYLQDWLLYQSDYNWRLKSALGGKSRAMADIGSHCCDLIEYVTGDCIQQLCAQYQRIYDVRRTCFK